MRSPAPAYTFLCLYKCTSLSVQIILVFSFRTHMKCKPCRWGSPRCCHGLFTHTPPRTRYGRPPTTTSRLEDNWGSDILTSFGSGPLSVIMKYKILSLNEAQLLHFSDCMHAGARLSLDSRPRTPGRNSPPSRESCWEHIVSKVVRTSQGVWCPVRSCCMHDDNAFLGASTLNSGPCGICVIHLIFVLCALGCGATRCACCSQYRVGYGEISGVRCYCWSPIRVETTCSSYSSHYWETWMLLGEDGERTCVDLTCEPLFFQLSKCPKLPRLQHRFDLCVQPGWHFRLHQ